MIYEILIGETVYRVELQGEGDSLSCKVNDGAIAAGVHFPQPDVLSLLVDGCSYEIRIETTTEGNIVAVHHDGGMQSFDYQLRDPRALRGRKAAGAGQAGPQKITAPMPGKVVRILAEVGSEVEQGQSVIVIEAMKMQNELKAPRSGKVAQMMAVEGATVNPGDTLAVIG